MKSNKWRVVVLLVAVLVALASAGCPGTNILPNGNATVLFEVVLVGQTVGQIDCLLFEWNSLNILPLDGTCEAPGADTGDPCYRDADCDSMSCEGSAANLVLGDAGYPILMSILGTTGQQGNLTGGACVPADVPPPTAPVAAAEFSQPISVVLPAGLYRMDNFRVGDVFTYNAASGDVFRCTQKRDVTSAFPTNVTHFSLGSGQTRTVRIELDAEMVETLISSPSQSTNCNAFFDAPAPIYGGPNFLATVNLSVD